MRLHGVHSFNAFPMVVRSGGMLNAFGPKAGRKVVHPDNGDVTIACEGSVKLLFDEHNHPVSSEQYKKMPEEQKAHCQWRCCYKMVTLLHTNRNQDFYFFVAVKNARL